jgi:hypothetical protein
VKPLSNGAATAGSLLRASRHAVLEDLPDLIAAHARPLNLARPLVHLVDVQQQLLRLVLARGQDARGQDEGAADGDSEAELRVDATLAGRAFHPPVP